MIIRLLATQISRHWDVIKYALQQVERLGVDDSARRFNHVFASLLSDKSQCFLKHIDNEIQAVMITEIIENSIDKKRTNKVRLLYAFKPFTMDEWDELLKVLRKLAISEKCSTIMFETKHPKILTMAENRGFTNAFTTMVYAIGD